PGSGPTERGRERPHLSAMPALRRRSPDDLLRSLARLYIDARRGRAGASHDAWPTCVAPEPVGSPLPHTRH
ncbi:MAG TPA: hypothetical protein VNM90_20890, partial [Haliangium sp.]|nr:hypothetical protein [Haliangium sp.]